MDKKKIIIIISVIVIMLVLAIVLVVSNMPKTENEVLEETKNISQNENDLELTGDSYSPSAIFDENGVQLELSQFADKPMALLFFNTTELEANNAITIFQKYFEFYKDQINFVNISVIDGVTESKDDVKNYIDTNKITIPVVYDTNYTAKNEYEIEKIPTFVFINKNNEIINTINSDINEDVIEANLDILAENY